MRQHHHSRLAPSRRRLITVRKTLTGLPLVLTLGACGPAEEAAPGATSGQPNDAIATTTEALTSEIAGGVAERVVNYYNNPVVARVSYATPSFFSAGGCSATMIGPNVLMTAAHCGQQRSSAVFRVYRNLDLSSQETETFTCDPLVSTFCDADTVLYYCRPNAQHQNPGDKYGYLDFDTSVPPVGTRLFSVWSNSIDNQGIGVQGALLYSEGQVTANNDNGWYVAQNNSSGIRMDLWGQPGASGSSHVNAGNGRLQVGPLSTAPSAGGRDRSAGSMQNILYWGSAKKNQACAAPGFVPWDEPTITGLGLTPANYEGWIDEDSNYLFDIQEDLEKRAGETRRDFYDLGFDSPRRNALWTATADAQFQPTAARVRISKTTTGPSTVLSHARLNLEPGLRYRLGIRTSLGRGLVSVVVRDGAGTETARTNIWPSMYGPQAMEFTAPVGARIDIVANGVTDGYVSNLVIANEWTYTTFELADERRPWVDAGTNQPAMILPDGKGSGPNWALRVERNTSLSKDADVRKNDDLAMVAGKGYTVCFDVKDASTSSLPNPGRAQLVSGGTVVGNVTFDPSATWQTVCSSELRPTSAQTSLRFNVDTVGT
ncbi:MAG: hypothetical protein HOO96_02455, partial [Polyangiaceae bacterium]|nr:hypothetical protein [Polyangiaceae bacterium]